MHSPVHHVASTEYSQREKYLWEDLILPELLDNLSDVPQDIFSESDSDDSVKEINIVWPVQSESESSTSSKESGNTSNVRATMWVEEDKTPNVGHFTGNPGVKQIPSDPTEVPKIIKLSFRDNFEMLCKETNQYYFQNQGNYASSSTELKWVDKSY
jgi:hypothetical protein